MAHHTHASLSRTHGELPARLSPAAIASRGAKPQATHSGATIDRFYHSQILGALFPVVAGMVFYGWHGIAVMGMTIGTSLAAFAIWRQVGRRGAQMQFWHTLWMSMLLAVMLPAHLVFKSPWNVPAPEMWAIVPGAAILLVVLMWLLGGVGSGCVHPVIVAYLAAAWIGGSAMTPHTVLQRNHLLAGNVANAADAGAAVRESWAKMPPIADADAIAIEPASQRLISYTTAAKRGSRNWLSLEGLLRDEMPALEDLIVGGHPGPVGAGCAALVIIGGLFLMYRGVIDYRIPTFTCIGAIAAFVVLPIPLVITETAVKWQWLAINHPDVSAATMTTFIGYEMMAGPMMMTAFYLASCPAVRPMPRRGRVIFGLLIGMAGAAAQLYVSVSAGPYLALLAVALLTPGIDRFFKPNALV